MSREQKNIFQNIDWIITGLFLLLVLLGWLNIYAAVYNDDHNNILDISQKYGKQMMWIAGALIIAIVVLIFDANFFTAFPYPIYIASVLSLIAVIFFGTEVSGSKSWFRFGDFGLQPAEFGKFAVCLALAKYMSAMNTRVEHFQTKVIAFSIVLFPALLIVLQKEAGTALVYTTFIFVLFREGFSGNILLGGFFTTLLLLSALLVNKTVLVILLALIAAVISFAIWVSSRNRKKAKRVIWAVFALLIIASGAVLGVDRAFSKMKPHQKTRINVFLGKEVSKDMKKKAGYNVNQSLIAIGSGGFSGKGFLQGTQTKYNFVPEQSTDFIFCTVGEEWGFLGSAFILFLFLALILRILFIAERQRSSFSRIYGYGVASILFFHVTVNVGMTIGLAPVIGIPLPFFSYGGSSLWAFTILLFIFIKLDSNRLLILR
ncbi:MAG: rod shape-determining protein RodA [Bacteroidetes bacterium]|nr:MAG: rod shape-determining protein RodA [Bacteroidota bacterium]